MDSILMPLALAVGYIATAVFVTVFFLQRRCMTKYRRDIENYRIKNKILSTNNEFLKSLNDEYKGKVLNLQVRRALIQKELNETTEKLEEAQKKMASFSKMIKDMKNS